MRFVCSDMKNLLTFLLFDMKIHKKFIFIFYNKHIFNYNIKKPPFRSGFFINICKRLSCYKI